MPARIKLSKAVLIECEYALETPLAFNIGNSIYVVCNNVKSYSEQKTCETIMFSSSALKWALLDKSEAKKYSRSKISKAHIAAARGDEQAVKKDSSKVDVVRRKRKFPKDGTKPSNEKPTKFVKNTGKTLSLSNNKKPPQNSSKS